MGTITSTASTPRYLLLGSDGPIGPDVMQPEPDADSIAVYGFSSKARYDVFCTASEQALRPYPLLKGHLRKPPDFTGKQITVISCDPDGPEDSDLRSTTAESLVHSLESSSDQVPVEFHLTASHRGAAYEIHAVPPTGQESLRNT